MKTMTKVGIAVAIILAFLVVTVIAGDPQPETLNFGYGYA